MSIITSIKYLLPLTLRQYLKQIPLVSDIIYEEMSKKYEIQTQAAIQRIVKPGWVCADVGSNLGFITMPLARLVGPQGRVVAFDAFLPNVTSLKKRIERRKMADWVVVENLAISDGSQERLVLYEGRGQSCSEWNIVGHDVNGNKTAKGVEVPATSLDRYFKPGQQLDFVKMDIEGAEEYALPGMRRVLKEQQPVVLVEFHNEAAWAARKELFDAGYEFFSLEDEPLHVTSDSALVYLCLAKPRK
jgi:FkbM family methyltransferase